MKELDLVSHLHAFTPNFSSRAPLVVLLGLSIDRTSAHNSLISTPMALDTPKQSFFLEKTQEEGWLYNHHQLVSRPTQTPAPQNALFLFFVLGYKQTFFIEQECMQARYV